MPYKNKHKRDKALIQTDCPIFEVWRIYDDFYDENGVVIKEGCCEKLDTYRTEAPANQRALNEGCSSGDATHYAYHHVVRQSVLK